MKPDIEEVLKQYNFAKKYLNKSLVGVDMQVSDIYVVFENRGIRTELFKKQKFLIILKLLGDEQYIFDPVYPPKIQQPIIRVEQRYSNCNCIFTGRFDGVHWNFDDDDEMLCVTTDAIKMAYEFMKSVYSASHDPSPEINSIIINTLIFPYSVLESMYQIQTENQ